MKYFRSNIIKNNMGVNLMSWNELAVTVIQTWVGLVGGFACWGLS